MHRGGPGRPEEENQLREESKKTNRRDLIIVYCFLKKGSKEADADLCGDL